MTCVLACGLTRDLCDGSKCAMIAAHYGMSDVYDNLVISLCKFTTLGNSIEVSRARQTLCLPLRSGE